MSTAAAEVGHVGAGRQPLWQAFGHRQDHIDQRSGSVQLAALLGHDGVEPQVFGIQQTTPYRKQPMIFCSTSPSSGMNCATRARLLNGGARERRGLIARQQIGLRGGVVVDDLPGDHAAQPLSHIAFVEAGGVGDLCAGGGTAGRRSCRTTQSDDRYS